MYFVSYRRKKDGRWLCLLIVKRWRPIYARINALLRQSEERAVFAIVTEELGNGLHPLR